MFPTMSISHWYSTLATGTPKSLISKTISFRFLRTLADGIDCLGVVVVFVDVVTGMDCCCFVAPPFVVAFVVVVAVAVATPLIKLSFVVAPNFLFGSSSFGFPLGFSLVLSLVFSSGFFLVISTGFSCGFSLVLSNGGKAGRSQRWRR